MQVCILAGGTGTRLKEQTEFIPKPMIPIGQYPMAVHIMKIYAHYGFKNFIMALGYKQEFIKGYFAHFDYINSDITILPYSVFGNKIVCSTAENDWSITLSDTGPNTLKGGRLKRIEKYVKGDTFMMTYGDAVADIDLNALLAFHQAHGRIATVTGIHPTSKFGELKHDDRGQVTSYTEKAQDDGCLTNGGFFVFNRKIFDYLDEDCDLEIGPLERLVEQGELFVYQHKGWWGCMDTPRELGVLQELWDTDAAPWRVWE